MMKKLALIALPALFLTGCSIEEVAQTAGDAAACNALQGTLNGLQAAYEQGLVDSGVLDQVDQLVGDQLEALLSSGLASDLRALSTELANTDSAQAASARIGSLTESIAERCEAVGVNVE
jgi:PBP1b-binding outer membrane lipoprotein LpoB